METIHKQTCIRVSLPLYSYGDMRVAMNRLIITKWRVLGSFQAQFVPAMLEPFLKMSMIPPTGKYLIVVQGYYI